MKKLIIFLFLFFSLSYVASASVPQYAVNNTFNTTIINGNNTLGNFILYEKPYQPEYFNQSAIPLTQSFKQYDVIIWQGTNYSIKIRKNGVETLLSQGSQYQFTDTGDYYIESMLNTSINAMFPVSSSGRNSFTISPTSPAGITIGFSQQTYVISGEQDISVTASVSKDLLPGNYTIYMNLHSLTNYTSDINYTYYLNLLPNAQWNITEDNVNTSISLKTGDIINAGYMKIQNNGNIDLQFYNNMSGNGTLFLTLPGNLTLFRNSYLLIPFQIQIPTMQNSDNYSIVVKFSVSSNVTNTSYSNIVYNNNDTYKYINVTVLDSILPTIENVSFNTSLGFIWNRITVVAKDNVNVENVTIAYDGTTYQMKKDGNNFILDTVFNKLSTYTFEFCAFDKVQNKFCQNITKLFQQLDCVNMSSTNVQLPKHKINTFSRIPLFNLTMGTGNPITLRLEQFQSSLNPNDTWNIYQVRIIDGDNSLKRFSQYTREVNVSYVGQIYLEVMGTDVSTFDGVIKIITPAYMRAVPDVSFSGKFLDYQVPPSFRRDWFGGNLSCSVYDTEDFDTSYYNCCVQMDLSISNDSLPIPTTIRERQQLDNEINKTILAFKKERTTLHIYISILVVALIFVLLLSYYLIYLYPYVRFYNKGSKEDD